MLFRLFNPTVLKSHHFQVGHQVNTLIFPRTVGEDQNKAKRCVNNGLTFACCPTHDMKCAKSLITHPPHKLYKVIMSDVLFPPSNKKTSIIAALR